MDRVIAAFSKIENRMVFQAIRRGLVLTIPVLLIGSLCLILLNLPIPPYQEFIAGLPHVSRFLLAIYSVTMGVFSLYAAISVSICYAQAAQEEFGDFFIQGAPIAALASYLLLSGLQTENFSVSVLSLRSLFIAIICGLCSSMVYCALIRRQKFLDPLFAGSTDSAFNRAFTSVLPIAAVVVLAAAVDSLVGYFVGAESIETLIFQGIGDFFPFDSASLESGVLYIFLNDLMWFFGLHGGNMLDGVAQSLFVPGVAANAALVAAGEAPTQIISKTFMDVFVSIGGAGALLSLLIAILAFGRRRSMRRLSVFAAVPMAFNISEIMMFGLPVIWNPMLLIPFLLVPIVNLLVSYGATAAGLVPYVTVDVSWITPPFIGGYLATGSWAGVALQAFNLLLGVALYLPFLRIYERSRERTELREYYDLIERLQDAEDSNREIMLTGTAGVTGSLARMLADDLKRAVSEGSYDLFYQPQYDTADRGVGAEALLRWKHSVYGTIYPPLVIKLADEVGLLDDLELAVFRRSLKAAQEMQSLAVEGKVAEDFSLSFNVTAKTLQRPRFVDTIIREHSESGLDPGRLVVEATEHDVLNVDDETTELLYKLTEAGMPLAIDDFSMGHTSFRYLETSAFSIVKLDGAISKGVLGNDRYSGIISSITRLSKQLDFKVLAEYVETREQRDMLEAIGCEYFQGYLYAPALPFEDMLEAVQKSLAKSPR